MFVWSFLEKVHCFLQAHSRTSVIGDTMSFRGSVTACSCTIFFFHPVPRFPFNSGISPSGESELRVCLTTQEEDDARFYDGVIGRSDVEDAPGLFCDLIWHHSADGPKGLWCRTRQQHVDFSEFRLRRRSHHFSLASCGQRRHVMAKNRICSKRLGC